MHAADKNYDTPIIFGKNVAVIGGGNTAMDSVRTVRRLGADKVMLIYRRSEVEMPSRLEEIHHAKEEGVEFMTLHNPVEYLADDKGRVRAMRVQRMELGEPDERAVVSLFLSREPSRRFRSTSSSSVSVSPQTL